MIIRKLTELTAQSGNGRSRRFPLDADGTGHTTTDTTVNHGTKSLPGYNRHMQASGPATPVGCGSGAAQAPPPDARTDHAGSTKSARRRPRVYRRNRLLLLGAGVAALAAAPTALALSGGSTPATRPAATTAGQHSPTASIASSQLRQPQAIGAGEGGIWVANYEPDGTVTKIDPRSGLAEGSPIAVGRYPYAIAVGYGSVWVSNSGNNTVSRISATSGQMLPISVGRAPEGIAVGGGSVWVVNLLDKTVTRIDATSGDVVGSPIRFSKGFQPHAIAVGAGIVWVASFGALERIDAVTGRVLGKPISIPGSDEIATGNGVVWAVDYDSPSLVVPTDAATGNLLSPQAQAGSVPKKDLGKQPGGIALGYGSVWVTNFYDNTLTRVNATTGRVIGRPIAVGSGPNGVAVGDGAVWVANTTGNTVTRINPGTS